MEMGGCREVLEREKEKVVERANKGKVNSKISKYASNRLTMKHIYNNFLSSQIGYSR